MSALSIRPAMPNELGDIVAIAQAADVYQPSEMDLEQTDVVCLAGKVVAFATWQAVCDEATLLSIAVDEDHRGQSIGKSLLEYAEQRLVKQGIKKIFLEVRASNHAAQQLYQGFHYQVIAERKDYYPTAEGREAAVIMSKQL
ncbi:ribosomal protein S18-alanine N-acetyltransferase [Cardiobacteriaceae bacterium TAE3-ERU3]|nr:ribosomal protein S18-alanine N-acetyltransferase [Cardiobacteriaceae bacterium TAE3-ERU3]